VILKVRYIRIEESSTVTVERNLYFYSFMNFNELFKKITLYGNKAKMFKYAGRMHHASSPPR
jgi:hypothetical protein